MKTIILLFVVVLLVLMIAFHIYTMRTEREKFPHCIRGLDRKCVMRVHKNFIDDPFSYDRVCFSKGHLDDEKYYSVCIGLNSSRTVDGTNSTIHGS